jgi:hypothetical protein
MSVATQQSRSNLEYISNLQPGDLIGIAYGNQIWPAYFLGYGKGGNMHFYILYTWLPEQLKAGRKLKKDYTNGVMARRVVRMDVSALNPLELEGYQLLKARNP